MGLRQSPLAAEHKALNAKLVDFGGWEMPIAYPAGTIAEHKSCRNDAVVFDVSHLGTVRLEGTDSLGRLQQTFTNDLTRIGPGKAQYTHLLDDNGFVVDDIIIWWIANNVFEVMPNASNTAPVTSAIGGNDITAARAVLAVQGPNARAKVSTFSPMASEVPHFGVIQVPWQDINLTVAGTGYTGEDGLEISVPLEQAAGVWQEVLNAGVTPAGLGARDTLRLEAGLPLHGHELGAGITPLQAGLNWVVAWNKGPFRGRAALEVERERGVDRRLRGLSSEGRQPLRAGNVVLHAGEKVGEVTSGNYSPMLNHAIAMAFLPPDLPFGTQVEIDVRGRLTPAEIVRMPFVKKA